MGTRTDGSPKLQQLTVARLAMENRLRLLSVATTGFVGGMAEALFLVLIVRLIVSITEDDGLLRVYGGMEVSRATGMAIAGVAVFTRLIAAVLTHKQAALLSNNMVAYARGGLIDAYFGADRGTQHGEPAGRIQEYVTSYTNSLVSYLKAVTWLIVSSANLVALLAIAIFLEPLGAISLVGAIVVLGALLRPLRSTIGRRSLEANSARVALATTVSEYVPLSVEMRVFDVEDAARKRLAILTEESRRKSVAFEFLSGLASPIYSVLAYGALLGLVIVMSLLDPGEVTALAAVMLLVLRSLTYGQAVQSALSVMSGTRPVADELLQKIGALESTRRRVGTRVVEAFLPLRADDVSYSYPGGPPVLKRVSFEISRREIVGMIGPSGGGKSTLVQLLLGLREPTTGTVRVGGISVGEIDPRVWASRVAFVPQSPGFLSGSIRDNVRFMREGVTDEEIETALKLAHLHNDVERTLGGIESEIGAGGGNLSGGQRQRLSIARALIGSPQFIVLDEPTSALDPRSEHLLRETMLGLRDRMAVLIVAHRMTTLDICDRIMVVEHGGLTAFDTPASLANTSAFYRESMELSGLDSPGSAERLRLPDGPA